MENSDIKALNEERATEIFDKFFNEIYLATTSNPIDFQTTKDAIERKMKIQLQDQQVEQLEKLFQDCCDNNQMRGLKKK